MRRSSGRWWESWDDEISNTIFPFCKGTKFIFETGTGFSRIMLCLYRQFKQKNLSDCTGSNLVESLITFNIDSKLFSFFIVKLSARSLSQFR